MEGEHHTPPPPLPPVTTLGAPPPPPPPTSLQSPANQSPANCFRYIIDMASKAIGALCLYFFPVTVAVSHKEHSHEWSDCIKVQMENLQFKGHALSMNYAIAAYNTLFA